MQNFEEYWKKARELINTKLASEIEKLRFSKYLVHLIKGGKRFRGTLTMLIAEALGGDSTNVLPFSIAIEMIHEGILIHDDWIDGHETRRGGAPLYKILDPRRAFLIADMLLSIAQSKLARRKDAYRACAKAIYEACRGAYAEPLNPLNFLKDLKKRRISENFYLILSRMKTAELFGVACKLGAIASGSNSLMKKLAYEYGINLGIAYQLADDLADYLWICKEGKTTALIAIKLAPSLLYFSPHILPKYLVALMTKKLDKIPSILREIELEQPCRSKIHEYAIKAKEIAERFPESKYKPLLKEAVDYMIESIISEAREKIKAAKCPTEDYLISSLESWEYCSSLF